MRITPPCGSCGRLTHYEGNVTAPNQTIYGCKACGKQTWVMELRGRQQQQQQPQKPQTKIETEK